MRKPKPVDDSHHACPTRRAVGLPKSWRSVASYRHYLNKQMELHAKGLLDNIRLIAAIKAAQAGTELLLIEAQQREDEAGLAQMPELEVETESDTEPGEVTDADFEEVEMKERPGGGALVVVLPTPEGKKE